MARKVTDEPTVYKYEAPTNPTPGGGLEEQDWRDQLFGVAVGVIVATIAVFPLSPLGLTADVFAVVGGICIGYGGAKYRVMQPEGGLLSQLQDSETTSEESSDADPLAFDLLKGDK